MKILLLISLVLLWVTSYSQTVNDLRPTVTMKEYVDAQIASRQELTQTQFQNINDNVNKATTALEKRLDGMNEFRQTITDSNATYITRKELFAWIVALLSTFFAYSNWARNLKSKDLRQ
jgi:predicted PurR-regulated permease PerM